MLSPLRNRFGIPGVISVVALVFAMLGGAYAASSNDNGKATASAKAKKGPRGPKGATGPTGPAGAQGPAGAKGDNGANGSNGEKGATGNTGTAGQSVTVTNENPGANCEEGGKKLVSVSGTSYVCNGEAGTPGNQGLPGSPWTAGGTLPVGSTETGAWIGSSAAAGVGSSDISFTVPLTAALDAAHVHLYSDTGASPGGAFASTCTGSAANPTAPSGHLCVYQGFLSQVLASEITNPITLEGTATKAGTAVSIYFSGAGIAGGTWAVTG